MTPADLKRLEGALVARFGVLKARVYVDAVRRKRCKVFCGKDNRLMILRAEKVRALIGGVWYLSLHILELDTPTMDKEARSDLVRFLLKVADGVGAEAVHAIPRSIGSRELFSSMGFSAFPGDPRVVILRKGPHKPVARRGHLPPATLARIAGGRR